MSVEDERKTRAIMFSDIKGCSAMMSHDESLALELVAERACRRAPRPGRGS